MEVKLMKIIGLTGGSGTGKGTVAARMRALGAGWVDADAVYRTLCAENRKMLSALDTAFGGVTDANGVLDRPETRENRVFRPCKAAAAQRNHHTVYPQGVSRCDSRAERVSHRAVRCADPV